MPKTILLADDSVTIQKVVAISFASEDVTVLTVDNGDDAITKAREARPDIVLADVVMPGKNGYEVCEAIKGDPELAQIPVLLLTGTFEAFDEARAREVGSAGHIAKPFEAQALIEEVRRLIDAAAASATPPPAPIPAESAESPVENDGAFDFFDDDAGAADLTPAENALDDGADLEFQTPADGFTFGDDELSTSASPLEQSAPVAQDAAPQAESVEGIDTSPFGDAIALDDELESPPETPAGAAFDDDDLDDSLAPDASRSGDQPFDFALAEEVTDPNDPLADLAPVPPVDANDVAQATVIDPLGASGYDVSSSDLGPPMAGIQPDPPAAATDRAEEAEMTVLASDLEPEAERTVLASDLEPEAERTVLASDLEPEPERTVLVPGLEPEAERTVLAPDLEPEAERTMLAPDLEPEANAWPGADPIASAPIGDDLTTVVSQDPVYEGYTTPEQAEPIAVAVDGDAPADLAAELYPEPAPAEPADTPAAGAAEPAEALMAAIEPELRQQLHDTLEKIAWESFGDLTDAIVRQAVERVESIAWEVIPRMAETLIQEEIRRMKAESEED